MKKHAPFQGIVNTKNKRRKKDETSFYAPVFTLFAADY